jgi:hypothetical protein
VDATLAKLLGLIETAHTSVPARDDAESELDAFVGASRYSLPDDVRTFYRRFRSATLFARLQLLPISEWRRTGAALLGPEWTESEPPSWYAFCDAFDGNFIGIDLARSAFAANAILDCDHDDIPHRRVIADSFTQFLDRALRSPARLFYLQAEFEPLTTIDVPDNPPLAWMRRQYANWSVDPELGPDRCRHPDCMRLHVALSVFCRKHHFEAINQHPYPFDD